MITWEEKQKRRKERLNKKLKKGVKLYRLRYWRKPFSDNYEREIEQHTIVEVFKNHIRTFGRGYKINKNDINCEYFFTKQEMYKNALRLHKDEVKKVMYETINPIQKEIKYLEKKIA